MTREVIRLDPDKVRFYIDQKGIPIKRLLDGMTAKTVHRIKAGKNTTRSTANKLATKLGVTVEDLSAPLKASDLARFLPDHWLYDDVETPSGIADQHFLPCSSAFNGFICLLDQSPTGMFSPLTKLIRWISDSHRKIVLRQEEQAFILEIHYFSYSPAFHRTTEVDYSRATACRFFPMERRGDRFEKVRLSDWAHRYIWNHLIDTALAQAEIVSIEGHEYPDDPRAYFPLVRFYKGLGSHRVALGARVFLSQFDLRESLLAFLNDIPKNRVHASMRSQGVSMTIEASFAVACSSQNWLANDLEMKIDLAWRMSDGRISIAPWRQSNREKFVKGIDSRDRREMHLDHMPLRFHSENDCDDEDAVPTPFEADPSLLEGTALLSHRDESALF
jgi:hypothetical protein